MKRLTLEEQILKEHIKQLVRESIMSMGMPYEAKDDDKDDEKDEKGVSDMNNETPAQAEKRNQIEDFFEQPGVTDAQYAYKLFGVKDEKGKDTNAMKNARSKFSKKLKHKKNSAGYPYSLTPPETNQLQSMISNNQLSEAVAQAIGKLPQTEKRKQVEDFFEKGDFNKTHQYAVDLYGKEKYGGGNRPTNKFYKNINNNGQKYSLTPPETNQLQSMISDNQLSEAVAQAIRKVIK